MSLRKNLAYLEYEEMLEEADYMINDYRSTNGGYGHTQLADIQYLDKALQRVVFEGGLRGDTRPQIIQNEVKALLVNGGLRVQEKKNPIKSTYEIEREKNGFKKIDSTNVYMR